MSDKKLPSYCLIVDADVARASGPPDSKHPTGSLCREFLMTLRSVGHRVAMNTMIRQEWEKHQSNFARTWYLSMVSIGKTRKLPDNELEDLREAIRDSSTDDGVVKVMLKDAHLIEAGLASDRRVASMDETVRKHFRSLSSTCESIAAVMWINPANKDEGAGEWLKRGAPDQLKRRLSS